MMKFSIAIMAAAVICLSSCKNGKTGNQNENATQAPKQEQSLSQVKPEEVDVVFLANLYCKTTPLHMAKVFRGTVTDNAYTVRKDVENNYAKVYANTNEDNYLEFYMWTDIDGSKILGINLKEQNQKEGQQSLQFFTYDSRLNLAVPVKRLNEIVTNKMMSLRRGIYKFIFRLPTSPENEDITLGYWERKDKEKYNELVFKWDGHSFII